MKKLTLILTAALMLGVFALAQEHKAAEPAKSEPQKASETKSEPAAAEHQAAEAHEAAAQGEHAGAKSEGEGETDTHKQFTESPSVKWLGRKLGVSTSTAYKISLGINAVLLGMLFWYIGKNGLPGILPPIGPALRERQDAITRGISEAREASAKAAARLTEIEARLGKLDTEIATMRSQAENEARAEEERLKAATEEEKRKIVQSAEQEIAAAANSARRDLKNLAAELAVSLAEKKISVDENTDKSLVREFANSLNVKGGN